MNREAGKRDWFYWFMAGLTATQLPFFLMVLLDFVRHPLAPDYSSESVSYRLFTALVIAPVAVVIALLVIRRAPRNVTGLFLLLWATIMIGETLRQEALVLQSLSIGWVGLWFLPLFFPDGRAYPRRLEPHIRALCVALAFSVVLWSLASPTVTTFELPNPLFIPALAGLLPIVSNAKRVLLITVLVIILPSLIARYRHSDQRVRQQLKWLVFAFTGILITAIPLLISGITLRDPQTLAPRERLAVLAWSLFITLTPFTAVAIAILRHNLYDIDIIIRKTLVYSLLTGILAATYFGSVVAVQQLVQAATGKTPEVAIVVSTLFIAALFGPPTAAHSASYRPSFLPPPVRCRANNQPLQPSHAR